MTVKAKLVNGNIETFDTPNYVLGPAKEMHPDIISVKVYSGSKLIASRSRLFPAIYKKFIYKSLPVPEPAPLTPEEQQESAVQTQLGTVETQPETESK